MPADPDTYQPCVRASQHRGVPPVLVPIVDGVCGRAVFCAHAEDCEIAVVATLRRLVRRLDAIEAALARPGRAEMIAWRPEGERYGEEDRR